MELLYQIDIFPDCGERQLSNADFKMCDAGLKYALLAPAGAQRTNTLATGQGTARPPVVKSSPVVFTLFFVVTFCWPSIAHRYNVRER